MSTLHCTKHIVQCTLYNLQCNVLCTVYTNNLSHFRGQVFRDIIFVSFSMAEDESQTAQQSLSINLRLIFMLGKDSIIFNAKYVWHYIILILAHAEN